MYRTNHLDEIDEIDEIDKITLQQKQTHFLSFAMGSM